MALRTFRCNPSLGGFGHESSRIHSIDNDAADRKDSNEVIEADAFAQILKELVDNAVDACRSCCSEHENGKVVFLGPKTNEAVRIARRVLVKIQPEVDEGGADDTEEKEILRVTVTDNGCGMKDIQSCVDPFSTNKAHNAVAEETTDKSSSNSNNTAGRYGIGLTLCLLHAQRLVPSTRTSIQSATADAEQWSSVACVVDTENDSVRCVSKQQLDKRMPNESGTSISLLLPGGRAATNAWPRLASYFSNFQLSLGLTCSLQVMAACLSNMPLYVQPVGLDQKDQELFEEQEHQPNNQPLSPPTKERAQDEEAQIWIDPMESPVDSLRRPWQEIQTENQLDAKSTLSGANDVSSESIPPQKKNQADDDVRSRLRLAAQKYMGCDIRMENVAHAKSPIRLVQSSASKQSLFSPANKQRPQMQVDVIVHNNEPCSEEDDKMEVDAAATLSLVRTVNCVPLLESAHIACGLVQGMLELKKMRQAFGLNVTPLFRCVENRMPAYQVKDSDQVAPFFQNHRTPRQFDLDSGDEDESNDEDSSGDEKRICLKDDHHHHLAATRKRPKNPNRQKRQGNDHRDAASTDCLRPAHSRLGKILVICHIHANPTILPLPTLCKGRLPLEDGPLLSALEVCLTKCLRQLQKSNPSLFLTTKQLKTVERNVKFVPALAHAVSSIAIRQVSSHPVVDRFMDRVEGAAEENDKDISHGAILESLIEERLRASISLHGEMRKKRMNHSKKSKVVPNAEAEGDCQSEGSARYSNGENPIEENPFDEYEDAFRDGKKARTPTVSQSSALDEDGYLSDASIFHSQKNELESSGPHSRLDEEFEEW